MSDIHETVSEAVEAARESRLNSIIALLVALTATFMALSAVKAGNLAQAMGVEQALTNNSWAYFQSKSTKQSLAAATLVQLTVLRDLSALTPAGQATLEQRIAKYSAEVERYEREKNDIKAEAEGHQKTYDALNIHDDQFDLSDAALSVAIALFGITALTQKRALMVVAIIFMVVGVFFGIAAFLRLDVHPDALMNLLG
jgi:uncharacterized small protein (DUF1192 family)